MVEWRKVLQRVDDYRWELPASYKPGMLVPARVYADESLLELLAEEHALDQAANVAMLPGIVWRSLAMPDIHWGYGFPIGGVAAMRVEDGVVSPGGVGFDINCGTRILLTNLTRDEIAGQMKQLADQLFRDVPAGLGGKGPLTLTNVELDDVMVKGSRWMIEHGYGWPDDLEATESSGHLSGADPAAVSERARKRGAAQLGTLGSGNHFLEVQALEEVYDRRAADCFGLGEPGQVLVFLHTGSRGFGHQVCQDYLDVMESASERYGFHLPDKQLACAPVRSPEGSAYLAAMNAAANFAWANRQYITYWVRRSFARVFGRSAEELGMRLVYDVAHNIAKIERHNYEGREIELCVHRKGATRAFPAGHPEVPARYREVGQPVLIPGDMGRYSYICVGEQRAMAETWGSTCHGAGRIRSRHEAIRLLKGVNIAQRLERQGILVRAHNKAALAEEASEAYKDVAGVVDVLEKAGIARRVARMRPLAVIKG
ncbi:MAG TPA: RtcB family protein [Dehalococcoidia bacterium]|nr:RtcB family protein [Dehalococcoidia bacterium]